MIGPTGTPGPTATAVTGEATNDGAGGANAGLPEYQAVLRATKRAPILRETDTTWNRGCTPQQVGGCAFGSWYLLDTKHERVLDGPTDTEAGLYSGYQPAFEEIPLVGASRVRLLRPASARGSRRAAIAKAVRVNPGTVLVEALPTETNSGKVINGAPNSYYVLNDEPVLTDSDITHPQQSLTEGAGTAGQPSVSFGFTTHGKIAFEHVTKEIARRGLEMELPGVSKEEAEQHFAVVLDGKLITVPSIDVTKYPEGINASTGSEITGDFTITSARVLADDLQTGALPVRLALIARPR